jgi:hypothetical protein
MAGIDDDMGALDFDLTCTLRLEIFDFECRKTQAKLTAIEVSKMFSGSQGGDPYSDSNTKVW